MHNVINNNATLINIRHSYFLNMVTSYRVQLQVQVTGCLDRTTLKPETYNHVQKIRMADIDQSGIVVYNIMHYRVSFDERIRQLCIPGAYYSCSDI